MAAFFCINNTANLDPGYYPYVSALETKMGRKFAGVRINGGTVSPYDPGVAESWAAGRTYVYYNGKVQIRAPDTVSSETYWKNIAAGSYDQQYLGLWSWVQSLGLFSAAGPFYYSPQHEQIYEAPCGPGAGTPADWIACFRHVHDLCVSHGYHISAGGPIALCMVPSSAQVIHDPEYGSGASSPKAAPFQISQMDPGPEYYDRVGMDIYWKADTGVLTVAETFGPLAKWAKAVGKPWMTGELGIDRSHDAASFLHDLAVFISQVGAGTKAGQCRAICTTSRLARGGDYRFDATAASLSAWRWFGSQSIMGAYR